MNQPRFIYEIAADIIELIGWHCGACGTFTGLLKEQHIKCRACNEPRPVAPRIVVRGDTLPEVGE